MILVASLLILLILPLLALSQTVEFYVIGLTPPEKSSCVIPGQTHIETFRVTSNSSGDENLSVAVSDVSWATSYNYLIVPASKGFEDLPIFADPPKETPAGNYTAKIYICTNQPEGQNTMLVKSCLMATYKITVDYSCEMSEVTKLDTRTVLRVVMISTIAVLVLILLYRNGKLNFTYHKKRRK